MEYTRGPGDWENVGDFSYGEGIYIHGNFFAIASQDRMIKKLRGDSSATGNRIIIEAACPSQAESIIKYDLPLTNTEMLNFVGSPPPPPVLAGEATCTGR